MEVSDAMSTPVVTVSAEASLSAAAERMREESIGSVVVTRRGNPAGILTEGDFVAAGLEYDRPFSDIPVYAAASGPLVTIREGATLRQAARKMHEEAVKHLPVADGIDLVGILTTSDLVAVQEELGAEARAHLTQRAEWTREE
ncbi:MAG: CBS domain-containing protein, partial [Halobacterium sp.]